MSQRDYPRLDYKRFGQDLLDTCDLDPIYPMLARARGYVGEAMLKRWLLAYWCYYSAGVASYISTQADFYKAMLDGVPKYPRGHERRHFRGQAAYQMIAGLQAYGEPERVVDTMTCFNPDRYDNPKPVTAKQVMTSVQMFRGFGPWISWKVADMAERVLCIPVDFSDANLYMYRDPVQGAALVKYGDKHHAITEDELVGVVNKSLRIFSNYKAPPYQDRSLNVQEVETILCKWKAHMYGHYSMGLDSFDIAHGLEGWGKLAGKMLIWLKESTAYLQ